MAKHVGIHHHGFTLTEVIAVVIILGVLATLSFPTVTGSINRMRSEEAKNILRAYYMGFMDFARDTGADPTDLADIDTEVSDLKYYEEPEFSESVSGYSALLKMESTDGNHTIVITRDQNFICVHPSGQSKNCTGMGLPIATF